MLNDLPACRACRVCLQKSPDLSHTALCLFPVDNVLKKTGLNNNWIILLSKTYCIFDQYFFHGLYQSYKRSGHKDIPWTWGLARSWRNPVSKVLEVVSVPAKWRSRRLPLRNSSENSEPFWKRYQRNQNQRGRERAREGEGESHSN